MSAPPRSWTTPLPTFRNFRANQPVGYTSGICVCSANMSFLGGYAVIVRRLPRTTIHQQPFLCLW
ncbi:hypothetical protein BBK36DRAFT_1162384 [Trichoderma citrinoviride]|uniref:Uncharacterized protein n=1 Tax=Trichoderma citrinoviride TaxID=58853 RepID=A0A2T4B1A2_9HYPO|nr:hypothetical protein BBK36DRAFT_1162384 [Trichoderma citrinoviride]PTB63080.1 hypothetical protein BBK36DRAFT_1162384 [Trichoderma citrinoviride]